ncbi:MAG TPA: SWIM zinc finger family protein [Tepidisphaeraceae bacterium]|jgi:uncharacterized Zn finger protein|nr:SWIM zinc finger family protein [Tepidisphaeraceae bacterium]
MGWYDRYGDFPAYVSVAERRKKAAKEMERLAKTGRVITPVKIEGKKIAATFWGKAWCENLERYSDLSSRLPRGKTYVRNGSVVDLQIEAGKVTAIVSGSELYDVTIDIKHAPPKLWSCLKNDCSGKIGSLVELLQGKLAQGVMELVTRKEGGLFPKPAEITMKCSCPDYAGMCKHIAAVLYGIGARLDLQPELLFTLRQVDHRELITQAAIPAIAGTPSSGAATIADSDLADVFGIELDMQGVDNPAKALASVQAASQEIVEKRPRSAAIPEPTKRKRAARAMKQNPVKAILLTQPLASTVKHKSPKSGRRGQARGSAGK